MLPTQLFLYIDWLTLRLLAKFHVVSGTHMTTRIHSHEGQCWRVVLK